MNAWEIRDLILFILIIILLIISAVIFYKKNKKQNLYDSSSEEITDIEESVVAVENYAYPEEKQVSVKAPAVEKTMEENIVCKTENYGVHTAKIQSFKAQADMGDAEAMYNLSLMFKFFIKDKVQYLLWLEKAANAGHVKAMGYMGQGYSKSNNEEGLDPFLMFGYSKEKYYYWAKKAADTGRARGVCELADYYREEEDYENAYQYYKDALEKSGEENDEYTALYAAGLLADRYEMLWTFDNKEEDFLAAQKYYSFILFYKGDTEDPDSDYPMKYLSTVSKLGCMYYRRYQKDGASSQYGRLAAYCLFMSSICDLKGIYKKLISEPLSQLTEFISVDDMIEWEVHARHCAYLPDKIINK